MRIESLEPLLASLPSARGTMSFFFLRISTDTGQVGYGEACDSYGCSYPRVLQTIIEDAYAPWLIGESVDTVQPLIERLRFATRRRLGDAWAAVQARSAVEIALWDVLARSRSVSVPQLLGAQGRQVPIYASGTFLEEGDPQWHVDQLAPLLERGVRLVKLRLGPTWRGELEMLRTIRGLLDDDIEIAIDGSETFSLPTAKRICSQLAELDIAWFEEPLMESAAAGIGKLTRSSAVPIAYGEHLYGRADAIGAMSRGELDIIQPDAATIGGIEDARQVALAAEHFGVQALPHNCAGPIALMANAAVAASVRSVRALEYGVNNARAWSLFSGGAISPELISDGFLTLPEGPGFGLELDEATVRTFPYTLPGATVAGTRGGTADRFAGDR